MKFDYSGIDLTTQQTVSGDIEAFSESEALRELQKRRVEVVTLNQQKEKLGRKRKVSVADLALPLQEMATLTESGVVLVDALNALSKNKEHAGLALGFKKLASLIESGESFSSAIKQSALPFPEYVQYLVKAGELSGELATALRNASSQLNYDEELKNDLRSALTYPLVLIGSGIAAMIIIFFAVVPKFSHLLNGDTELPTLAYLVLSAGAFANENPYLLFGGAFAALPFAVMFFTNRAVRTKLANVAIEMPLIGSWLAEQDAARWASLCGAMLGARVGLLNALTLAAQSSIFTRRKQRALKMVDDIQSGISMPDAIERAGTLPGTSLNLITVGDKTGKLADMMQAVAKLHDEACKRKMKQVMTLIEPLAILIVGVLIGIMILGVVLAITASTDMAL